MVRKFYLVFQILGTMLVESLIVFTGVIIILLLAEIIIKNSIELSKHYGVSGTFIGLTVLSIGTSIPEIMTHIIGSLSILQEPSSINTLSALVIGTNIGSDIFQQNFILPIVGLIGTIIVIRKNLFVEVGGLIAAALLVWIFSLGGFISRIEGLILLIAYIAYLIYLKKSRISEKFKALNHLRGREVWMACLLILICFIIMAFVSDKVLGASVKLVESLSISASFFGVIVIGIAAALPELTTALVALKNRQKGMSTGVLIGSNITNPTLALGLGAMVSTYVVPKVVVWYDLPVKILSSLLIFWFLWRHGALRKKEAVVLIGMFLAYLVIRQMFFPVDF